MNPSTVLSLPPPHPVGPASDRRVTDRFERVVRLAQHVFAVPMVGVHLVDDQWLRPLARGGLPDGAFPREGTFCAVAVDEGERLVVPDATLDQRFIRSPAVTGALKVRFYAGEPIMGPGGRAIGTLCLLDSRPRRLTAQESRLLRDLADWVEQELAVDAEAAQAKEVQRRLMPSAAVLVEGYQIAGSSTPARNVGGDFFDWQRLDDGTLQVVVADVMGKGIPAAVLAAGARSALRGTSRFNDLESSVERVAANMEPDLDDAESFVTMFAARIVPETGELTYVDAGHGLALILEVGDRVRRLASHDPPLGAVPGTTWRARHEVLAPGETLLIVSDGILDVFPGPREALEAAVALRDDALDAEDMAVRITQVGGGEPLDDDVTAVVVRRFPR